MAGSMVVAKVGAQQCKRCNIQQNVFYTKWYEFLLIFGEWVDILHVVSKWVLDGFMHLNRCRIVLINSGNKDG